MSSEHMFGEWRDIEEAKKDGTRYIVWPPTWENVCSCAFWDKCEGFRRPNPYWRRIDDLGYAPRSRDNPPTHFMPVPEGPKLTIGDS